MKSFKPNTRFLVLLAGLLMAASENARAEAIWGMMDMLRTVPISQWDIADLRSVDRVLADSTIERHMRPSAKPGVDGGGAGASPKQLAFAKAFWSQSKYLFAAAGGNQSGKTATAGGMCFSRWLRDRARDGDVFWVIAQTHETMRDIPHKTMWEYLPRGMFGRTVYHPKLGFGHIPTLQLRLPDGRGSCEVWFRTQDSDLNVFESARLNGVWWTECTREAIFDALQPRLVARGGWLLMDYVPTQAWHKFRIRLNPDVHHVTFCMQDNAHNLAPGAIPRILRSLTDDQAAVRVYGKERAAFGVVYKEFDEERHVCTPFQIPKTWPRWRCGDYGYRNPAAILWGAVSPMGWTTPWGEKLADEALWFYREYYERERTVPQLVATVNELSAGEAYEAGGVVFDPTVYNVTQANGRSIAQELMAEGLPCVPGVRTSAVGEHALVARVRKWFEAGRLRFFNTCANAIREHQSWRYAERKDGIVPGNEPFEDKDNHTCDAVRYLVAADPSFEASRKMRVIDMEGA